MDSKEWCLFSPYRRFSSDEKPSQQGGRGHKAQAISPMRLRGSSASTNECQGGTEHLISISPMEKKNPTCNFSKINIFRCKIGVEKRTQKAVGKGFVFFSLDFIYLPWQV